MNDKNFMERNTETKNKVIAVLKFAVLILIVAGVPLYIYVFQRDLISQFDSFEDVVEYLRQYKQFSIPVYLAAEVLQIMVFVLPGQVFQFAAGYLFGFVQGLIYTFIGAVIGTSITFYIARILGSDAVHLMLGEEKSRHYTELLSSKKAYLITFLIYLIPGLPKDAVCYAAGLSDIRFLPFLVISVAGRMPAMAGSIAFGALYMKKDYIGMAVVAAVVGIICIISFVKRKDLTSYIDRLYEKYR